jgi:hypothetical protein
MPGGTSLEMRGYLTAVLISCDQYECMRRDAGENRRIRWSPRSVPEEPFRRTRCGPYDCETARLFAQDGFATELDEMPEEWLPGE